MTPSGFLQASVASGEAWHPAEFSRVLGNLPTGAYVCDKKGLITYYNRRAAQMWGREPLLNDPRDRYCGSSRLIARDGSPLPHEQCWMARAVLEDREFSGYEITMEQPGGQRVTALAHAKPVHAENGELLGAVNVLVDISDRKRSEATKDDFLTLLAHELRNPLGPVRNAVHILKSKGTEDAQTVWALDLIERQLVDLVSLIESVSQVSRLARGQLTVQRGSFAIGDLVATVVAENRALLSRKKQTASLQLPDNTSAEGDRKLLERAIGAMLQGASKSARTESCIEVHAFVRGDWWGLYVGPPGPVHWWDAVPIGGGRTPASPPTNEATVGVALIRGLVEAHRGSLTITQDQYLILLPLRPAVPEDSALEKPSAQSV